MLYSFFWVIPNCVNFMCRRFETLCLFHLHRWCKLTQAYTTYEEGTDSVPKRRHVIPTRENHPKEIIQHSEQGESLKSGNFPMS